MSKPFSALLKTIITILFACSAVPLFAQHGGGGHAGGGGGFHGGGGGGGFHGGGSGGGGRSGGGGGARGGSYAPPAAGYGAPRASAPYAPRSGAPYASRPGNYNNYARPGGNFAGGSQRTGNSSPASPGAANGQWHSFGGGSTAAGPSNNGGGFHVFSGNRGTGSSGAVRSFSGQGHEVYENARTAQNIVPKSQSLSTLHNSFNGSMAAGTGFRSNSTFSASSRMAGRSSFIGNRSFPGGLNATHSFHQMGGLNRFGRGCWNCGAGFGRWGNRFGNGWGWGFGGWGFGWPWFGFGFGFGDPFWFNPWWWGGPAYGYGYPGYPYGSVYGYPDPGYYAPDDNSNPPPPEDDQYNQYNQDNQNYPGNSNGNWATPNGPSPSSAPNSGNLNVPVLIYLKSGAVYTVRDYWMVDGELLSILVNGFQFSVDLEQVDLQRTNSENAKSGVKFIYKSEPGKTDPAPDGSGKPPGASTPAPAEQLHAVPQPEAKT